jgi:hypothetical protein
MVIEEAGGVVYKQGLSQPFASPKATVGAGIAKVTTATATAQPPSTSLQQKYFAREQDTEKQ